MIKVERQRITQHKRFVPDGTHPCLPSAQAGKFLFRKFFYAGNVIRKH